MYFPSNFKYCVRFLQILNRFQNVVEWAKMLSLVYLKTSVEYCEIFGRQHKKYSIQSLKTADSVWLSLSMRDSVLSGVPQGIVLGSRLFLYFINDLHKSIKASQLNEFADDSVLFKVIRNDSDRALLQQDLSTLEHWETTWQMSFNPTKCVVLRISLKKMKNVLQTRYTLHGHTLEVVDSSKYLGVTIKDDLSWETHVQNTVGKAIITLGFLRRNMKDCTMPVKDLTYKTMVRPTLEYDPSVWDPYQQTQVKALEQVQRRAAHYVCNDYTSRTTGCVTKMLSYLIWEPLEVRRRHDRLCMLYRIQHSLVDIPIERYLQIGDSCTSQILPGKKLQILHIPTPSFQEQCEIGTDIRLQCCLQHPWMNSDHSSGRDLLHYKTRLTTMYIV